MPLFRAELQNIAAAELEAMKAGKQIDEAAIPQRENDANAMTELKKKIRKKKWIAVSITAACLLAVVVLLHYFPVYRIAEVGDTSYFSSGDIIKLAYIGSGADRAEAQSILRQADAAFHDCKHTSAEMEKCMVCFRDMQRLLTFGTMCLLQAILLNCGLHFSTLPMAIYGFITLARLLTVKVIQLLAVGIYHHFGKLKKTIPAHGPWCRLKNILNEKKNQTKD